MLVSHTPSSCHVVCASQETSRAEAASRERTHMWSERCLVSSAGGRVADETYNSPDESGVQSHESSLFVAHTVRDRVVDRRSTVRRQRTARACARGEANRKRDGRESEERGSAEG